MKFSCTTSTFLSAVQLASRAISSQHALPILSNILLTAKGSECTVSATDLELSIVTSFPAEVEREGSITVSARALLNYVQYTVDPTILIDVQEGTQLRCSSKHGKTLIAGELATEFPTITPLSQEDTFLIDAGDMLDALTLTTFACARASLRPVLSGVLLQSTKKGITLVATDSYRLSEFTIPTTAKSEVTCIVPVKVLDELRTLLANLKPARRTPTEEEKGTAPKTEVRVAVSGQQIMFSAAGTTLLSRLIEGKFPDYSVIIPKSHTVRVILPLREFLTTVKRMHYFAKEINNTLTFTLRGQSLHISSPETQLGRDEATFEVEGAGADAQIALSSTYLLDFLSHISSEGIVFNVTDSTKPAIFTTPLYPNFLHLIMPLRMS